VTEEPAAESTRTVIVALAANLGIAVAKLAAALISRSSAMLAESFHALADSGNQVLLLVAQRRGAIPPDTRHPMGHGREAYFWALIASLGVFLTGALLSVRQGVLELVHPTEAKSFTVAYAVLAVSFVLESLSLRRAYRQIRDEARTLSRDFLEHLEITSDPIARAVFAEDATAVAGNLVAAVGLALHQITGSAVPDAAAALVIGASLGYVAFQLARRNADFLIGRQASAPIHSRIEEIIAGQPGVCEVSELLVTYLGPRRLWVVARIDIDDELSGARLKSLVRDTEKALTSESVFIARIDLVPTGR
jgi:cation diffusion facilitator family transporter